LQADLQAASLASVSWVTCVTRPCPAPRSPWFPRTAGQTETQSVYRGESGLRGGSGGPGYPWSTA